MASAIKNARRTLPHFWATFAESKKGESDFCPKVRLEDEHGIEHFWCGDIERKGASITGIVNNDPNVVQSVKIGQRIPIKDEQISDWLYMRDGKMIGNYTLRASMPSLTPEQLDQLSKLLGELPK